MRILVTGANGYLGRGIIKNLLDDGNAVIATDFILDSVDNRAEKVKSNIFEIEEPYELFQKPDVCLHLAWRDGFRHNSENHLIDLPRHYFFLEKMVKAGLKHLAIMGSVHEVGFFEGSVNENTPTNPKSLYGISKNALRQMIELLISEYHICYQWIRGYYIVGNTSIGNSIFSKITQATEEGKTEFPFVTGENQFDFLDYDEFCRRMAAIVEQKTVTGIINCCSGRPEKLGERVERFIRDNHYNIKLQYGVFAERAYDSKAIWGDSKKIEFILEAQK